jgi:hypothetical protein
MAVASLLAWLFLGCSGTEARPSLDEDDGADDGGPTASDSPGETEAGGAGDGDSSASGDCVAITSTDDWISYQPPHNFWRDENGLHWVANRRGAERLLLETYDPLTGAGVSSVGYDVLDVDPIGFASGAAHAPSGTVAVSYTLYEEGYERHYVLLTSVDEPSVYDVVRMPWDDSERVDDRALAWDGEAFVWHGLAGADGQLVVARFDEQGNEVLPLQVVGPPSTRLQDGFDMATDPASGTTWMVAPGGGAVRVTGTLRDGRPLKPDGAPTIVGLIDSPEPSRDARVSPGLAGDLMVAFTMSLEGFVAQRTTFELEELEGPLIIPNEEYASRDFLVSENGSAYWKGAWWLLTENGLGITAGKIQDGAVVDGFEVVHYPAREIFEQTGDFPEHMRLDSLSTTRFEDELWLGFFDLSATLGGNCRLSRHACRAGMYVSVAIRRAARARRHRVEACVEVKRVPEAFWI